MVKSESCFWKLTGEVISWSTNPWLPHIFFLTDSLYIKATWQDSRTSSIWWWERNMLPGSFPQRKGKNWITLMSRDYSVFLLFLFFLQNVVVSLVFLGPWNPRGYYRNLLRSEIAREIADWRSNRIKYTSQLKVPYNNGACS